MNRKDRILKAIQSNSEMDNDTIDNLLKVAYWMGREEEAKIYGDEIKFHIKKQRNRANVCRYKHLANRIIGEQDYIYSGNYSGDYTSAFGFDKTEIEDNT